MKKDVFLNIALNLPIHNTFTYKAGENHSEQAEPGKRVLVNFGGKTATGIILSLCDSTDLKKIKEIKTVLDEEKILTDELIEFCRWISDYYIAPIGEVLFSSIPRKININSDVYYFLKDNYPEILDKSGFKEEIYLEIIKTLERKSNTGLSEKQIEKALNYADLKKYILKLSEIGILYTENHFSRPTLPKLIKTVSLNISKNELTSLILKKLIKSVKQQNILKKLTEKEEIELNLLIKDTGSSLSSINTLFKKGYLKISEIRKFRETEDIFSEREKEIQLNSDQLNAIRRIESPAEKNQFRVFLMHGITGSGKTEVYINVIKKVLKSEKTAIVLVPEISLTPQLIYRFKSRFGDKVGVIHSKLSDGERLDTYDSIRTGKIRIIIGARSALFAPLKRLGIIIVDEEHDNSYKQENSPKYNGRDAAIYRGMLNNAAVILGSATPSVESYYNAVTGKYELLKLTGRASMINPPEIKIIDLNKSTDFETEGGKRDFFETIDKVRIKFLSKELIYEIGQRLEKKESVIILQNRRGYHSYLECVNCSNAEMCVRCNIALTYHKVFDLMKCHYCGYTKKYTKICSKCGSPKLIPKGAGTERVEEELIKIFPKAVIKRMDSDTLTSKKLYHRILKDFYDRKIDILAGTQIISKGLDFPDVTLAGVVNADIGLLNPDFRATEKTFQILTQVAGRSGRSEKKGEVLIQTNHPDFYVYEKIKNHDFNSFYETEIVSRKALNYPPFSRLVIIESKCTDRNLAESKIKEIFNFVRSRDIENIIETLPPSVPLFSKLKDRYRFHLILKSSKSTDPNGKYINGILKEVKSYSLKNIPGKVQITIDVDAVNLL
ncbi:MAG: primosomal protein N' [Ignavibacteria bacterium]|nr:primosomal protein N' [Ignavibacteria bacterium]